MIKAIWKVPATKTSSFKEMMYKKGLRMDSVSTFTNFLAGFNFFYETGSSYGDMSELAANNLARIERMNITEF